MSLVYAFKNWTLKVINNQEEFYDNISSYEDLFNRVLFTLDPHFFPKYKQRSARDMEEQVDEYLESHFNINRREELPRIEIDLLDDDQMLILFQLTLQLAIKIDQNGAIGHIVQLSSENQEALLPVVQEIVCTEHQESRSLHVPPNSPVRSSGRLKTDESDKSFISELERRDKEIRDLTELNEILYGTIKEARERETSLVNEISKAYEYIYMLKNYREMLLCYLYILPTSTFTYMMRRLRYMRLDYEDEIENLNKTVKEQRQYIEHSVMRLDMMNNSLLQLKKYSTRYSEMELENELRSYIDRLEVENHTKSFELQQLLSENKAMRDECDRAAKTQSKLKVYYKKYKELRKIHEQFSTNVERQLESVHCR